VGILVTAGLQVFLATQVIVEHQASRVILAIAEHLALAVTLVTAVLVDILDILEKAGILAIQVLVDILVR
jgi:hypothetical protein